MTSATLTHEDQQKVIKDLDRHFNMATAPSMSTPQTTPTVPSSFPSNWNLTSQQPTGVFQQSNQYGRRRNSEQNYSKRIAGLQRVINRKDYEISLLTRKLVSMGVNLQSLFS